MMRLSAHTKRLLLLFPLILLAGVTTWITYKARTKPVGIETPTHPDSFMTNVNAIRMNADTGVPQDQLISPLLVHYPINDTTDITTPHFIVYSPDTQPWHLYANQGQAQNGISTVVLWNNVVLHQDAGANNQELTMNTSELTIYPYTEIVVTQQPVVISEPIGIVHAVGMRANLNEGTIELLSQTRGHYDNAPTPPHSP